MPAKKPTTKRQKLKAIKTKPFYGTLVALIVLILVGDLAYHASSEETPSITKVAFYGWFSIASCILLLGTTFLLHKLIKRHEKYYRREAELS